jgi:hypothetical protein
MTNKHLRNLSLKILYAHFILILLLVFQYFTYSYTAEELKEITKLVIPMSTLYTSAALKFITDKSSKTDVQLSLSSDFFQFGKNVILGHYLLIFFIVLAGGFNWLPLAMITNGLLLIESLFGVFSGLLSSQLFKLRQD